MFSSETSELSKCTCDGFRYKAQCRCFLLFVCLNNMSNNNIFSKFIQCRIIIFVFTLNANKTKPPSHCRLPVFFYCYQPGQEFFYLKCTKNKSDLFAENRPTWYCVDIDLQEKGKQTQFPKKIYTGVYYV